jgi:uncharacterized protein YqcC (DUF446 family)
MEHEAIYELVEKKARQIVEELKLLRRWGDQPLPVEKFSDMGAFGSNTMTFEQWIQFVLLQRIDSIIQEKDDFPESSMVSSYAVRYFDGDHQSGNLQRLLSELDSLINDRNADYLQADKADAGRTSNSIPPEHERIPPTLLQVIHTLPLFTGDDLESQLQSVDMFIPIVSPVTYAEIEELLGRAMQQHADDKGRERLRRAINSFRLEKRCAQPYDHEEAMKRYRETHRKNFPNFEQD